MSNTEQNFSNQFLVALPAMAGDYFADSISLLVEHNAHGALGLMINRPLDVELGDLIPELDGKFTCQVLEGGPVEPNRLFFLHSTEKVYPETLKVSDEIFMTASSSIIEDLAIGAPLTKIIAVLGYAGWGAAQLEQELRDDIWLLTPTISKIVFDEPLASRPASAARLLGVDLNLMGIRSGHD